MDPTPARPADRGVVESVNVGVPRTVEWHGERITSGIWKEPVEGRVVVQGVNVVGDDQADRRVHGGADKAVYAYAVEDYAWWSRHLGVELGAATFGENLTLRGVAVSEAVVGERWRIGSVTLEVAQPRMPCYKLAMRMDDAHFVKRFSRAGRPGAYLRILDEGELAAGDPVEVLHRPGHGVSVAELMRIYLWDHTAAGRLLAVPELPLSWHGWARSRVDSPHEAKAMPST
jgi:MOSC domain-containing protein YiiM